MAFAEQSDVEASLGRALTDAEAATVETKLDDASDLVIGWCGVDFNDEPPPAVTRVVAGMVARAYKAAAASGDDPFAERVSNGPFSVARSAAASSGDVWLSAADKIKLRPHRVHGGMASVQLVGERYNVTEPEA